MLGMYSSCLLLIDIVNPFCMASTALPLPFPGVATPGSAGRSLASPQMPSPRRRPGPRFGHRKQGKLGPGFPPG
jgi:hypothetical protein